MSNHGSRGIGPEVVGERGGGYRIRIPRRIWGSGIVVGLVLVVSLSLFQSCFQYVHPNEYGIKEVKIGVDRGIKPDVYGPGFAFVMPFGFQRLHRFPRNVQVLELSAFEEKGNEIGQARYIDKAARIQTSDGFYVDVDVTILYKIVDPYRLITSVGPGRLYLDNGILPKAEPILKQTFGELTTEDFYNSPLRVEKGLKAEQLLNSELEPKGMKVDRVLVRYFKYTEEIQKNIEEKKLQDQLVFKNQALAKAATEEAALKRVRQEGEMKVKVTLQEGEAYKVKKDADRELYTRKKKAEADLLEKMAEAKRTELKNKAMQVIGSDMNVAMRMAEALAGLDTIIVPAGGADAFNPLDLNGVLRLFGLNVDDNAGSGVAAVSLGPPPPVAVPIAPTPIPSVGPPTALPPATSPETQEAAPALPAAPEAQSPEIFTTPVEAPTTPVAGGEVNQ